LFGTAKKSVRYSTNAHCDQRRDHKDRGADDRSGAYALKLAGGSAIKKKHHAIADVVSLLRLRYLRSIPPRRDHRSSELKESAQP
jgi:hypothetical protein